MQGSEDARSLELIENLARAKRALARELEANLRQLRDVLKESERIARQLEAVLQETQAPLEPAAGGQGSQGGHGRQDGGGARRAPELTGTLAQLLGPVLQGGAAGAGDGGAARQPGPARDGRRPRRFRFPPPAGDGKGTAGQGQKK